MALLYNVNRDSKKDPHGLDWKDVFPEWKEQVGQTEDQIFEAMMMWTKVKPLPS